MTTEPLTIKQLQDEIDAWVYLRDHSATTATIDLAVAEIRALHGRIFRLVQLDRALTKAVTK